MKRVCIFLLLLLTGYPSYSQFRTLTKKVGGPCEGCEAVFEYGNRNLNSVDTIPGYLDNQPKIKVTGQVFKKDGKTPVNGVIVYIYHTNRKGIYERKGNETGWARRHGFRRAWIKTGPDGRYTFYTFRPAAYPDHSESEHIHITIKEPDKNEYYLDEFVFDDDPLLTKNKRDKLLNRGGSGIVKLVPEKNGVATVQRNLILGLNIPDYE